MNTFRIYSEYITACPSTRGVCDLFKRFAKPLKYTDDGELVSDDDSDSSDSELEITAVTKKKSDNILMSAAEEARYDEEVAEMARNDEGQNEDVDHEIEEQLHGF